MVDEIAAKFGRPRPPGQQRIAELRAQEGRRPRLERCVVADRNLRTCATHAQSEVFPPVAQGRRLDRQYY